MSYLANFYGNSLVVTEHQYYIANKHVLLLKTIIHMYYFMVTLGLNTENEGFMSYKAPEDAQRPIRKPDFQGIFN